MSPRADNDPTSTADSRRPAGQAGVIEKGYSYTMPSFERMHVSCVSTRETHLSSPVGTERDRMRRFDERVA
ncbi:hypothetical protein [Haloterrigena turkmenica]|uniref:hypothetical protein n=1 Tax=Haloterrigena turkmenica TaxID=62320 RepID=UPI0006782958|nr:hypothetical protein [Haloterrigena turkmenica]